MYLALRLREGEDDDLIAWIEQQPNKSHAVREYLRRGLASKTSTAIDMAELRAVIIAAVQEALPSGDPAATNGSENPQLAERLDNLFG